MKNQIKRSVAGVYLQAQSALPGMVAHGEAIGLVHSKVAGMTLNVADLGVSRDAHDLAKAALKTERTALNGTKKASRAFLKSARGFILPHLEGASNETLSAAGFEGGSLAIPTADAAVLQMVLRVKNHFTANPTHENAGLNVTAARAGVLAASMAEGIGKVSLKKVALLDATTTRDMHATAVHNDVQTLLSELHVLLDPLDNRWEGFGFKRPGILQAPEVPQNLVIAMTGPAAVTLKWDKAARGRTYRVWKKVVGVDEDFVVVASITDLDFMLGGLPTGATVQIAVSASNNGGESALSEAVSVIVQ
jgi:hypothetical protein